MSIYTKEGWLDIESIERDYPSWLYVIVGKRQVGKTYGVLKHMLDNNRRHILLRRTVNEVDIMRNNVELSPYQAFYPEYQVGVFSSGKTCLVSDYKIGEDGTPVPLETRGMVLGLPTIANIRGFNGSVFTDLVFDEFIPEKHVVQRKTEGDALLNAYTTINGNREVNGQPPLRMWLLANSNSIFSPIVQSLKLAEILRDGEEVYYNKEDGICVIMPKSEVVTVKRKATRLMNYLTRNKTGDRFTSMALENEFAYDDLSMVNENLSVKGYKPLFSYADKMFVWEQNNNLFVTTAKHKKEAYKGTESDTQRMVEIYKDYMSIAYVYNHIKFKNIELLYHFKDLFSIKDIIV